jgi:hypothetical protein
MNAVAKASASTSWKFPKGGVVTGGHATKDAVIIKTGLVAQRKVTELVRCGKPLNTHRALGRHENTGTWIVYVGAEQSLKRTQEQRQINGMDCAENIDVAAVILNL